MKNILIVFGTRPEAIKLAPLIIKLKNDNRFKIIVCSTGQHREMLKPILQFFNITPDYDLDLMAPGQSLTSLSTKIMTGLQSIIDQNKIDQILVQGDTTSSFIGSLIGFYNKIKIIHLEAGLRSNNIYSPFPEEFNRKAISLVSTTHLAPTFEASENLKKENISSHLIHITGNTGIDTLYEVLNRIKTSKNLQNEFEQKFDFLNPNKKLILVTLHRRESFEKNIKIVFESILKLSQQRSDIEFIIPLHLNPEVRKLAEQTLGGYATWINKSNQNNNSNIWLDNPIDYIPFIYLMNKSYLIITDSGGIQEEAPSLGKPVLIARENTERPEAITAGTSKLIPLNPVEFIQTLANLLDSTTEYSKMAHAKNPFGTGDACERIIKILETK